jgi:hypothetical protein
MKSFDPKKFWQKEIKKDVSAFLDAPSSSRLVQLVISCLRYIAVTKYPHLKDFNSTPLITELLNLFDKV